MKKIAAYLAMSTVVLAGCGGGGGSGPGATASNLSVNGTASKGLLSGAEVQAYTHDANNTPIKFGQAVKTNVNGEYTLSLPKTDKPVVIEIKAVPGTKMLDETVVENGSFKSVDAPANLVIRTGVSSLTEDATAHANPYTEAAVHAALTATDGSNVKVPLTANTFNAAKGAIRESLSGSNPFMIRGVNANHDNITDDERKFTTLLAGIAQKGKETSCQGDSTGITCVIATLNDASKVKVDNTNKVTFADPTKQNDELKNIVNKAKEVNNSFVNIAKNSLPDPVKVTASVDPVVVSAKDSLEAFIKAMRDGFKSSQTTIRTATDDLYKRTKDLRAVAGFTGINEVVNSLKGCDINSEKFTCNPTSGLIAVTYTAQNNGFSYAYRLPYGLDRYMRTTGFIYRDTINQQTTQAAFSVTANTFLVDSSNNVIKNVAESKILANISVSSGAKFDNCTDCTFTISSSNKVYDESNQSKFITANLENITGSATITNGITKKAAASGKFTVSTADNDVFSGGIDKIEAIAIEGDIAPQLRPTNISLSFLTKTRLSDILSGTLIQTYDYSTFDPKKFYGNQCQYTLITAPGKTTGTFEYTYSDQICTYNDSIYNLSMKLNVAGNSSITYNSNQSEKLKRSPSLQITTNGNFISISSTEEIVRSNWQISPGSKTIIKSSSGDFVAEGDVMNGAFSGPIMRNKTQIGQITKNVIYVNGQEISLY